MSSACAPGGEAGGGVGGLCKLKFVTVGRIVALQPGPSQGVLLHSYTVKG